jgi:ABC-2 type transport system permease protein
LVSFILIMGMSSLGGSMAPVDVFPEGMKMVAHGTLNYWAIQGLIDQLVFQRPLYESWAALAVLCSVGVVTMSIGTVLSRRRLLSVMG